MSSAFEGLPKTPNLSLNKPGYDNVADIEALNENADILDEEISTIKSNLKNKGSATEPIYFDGNGVPQKTKNFNDYLPLAGGLMTDTVIGRSVNDSLLTLIGGTNGDNGATLMLYGKDNSSGRFLIRATDGTNKLDLVGTADGGLTWNNKEVFHSGKVIPIVNGGTGANNSADACANIGAYPITGGVFKGEFIVKENDNGALSIFGGTDWEKGAVLTLEGNGNPSWTGGGAFQLATGGHDLFMLGKPDGRLEWNHNSVECVVAYGTDYIRYANGLQITFQLIESTSANEFIVTLPMPFKDNNYAANLTDGGNAKASVGVYRISTNQVRVYTPVSSFGGFLICIGWWK